MKFNIWKIGTILIAGVLLVGIGVFLAKFIGNGQQTSQTSNQQSTSNGSFLWGLIPTSKPTPHPSAQNALKSLRKMSSATKVGISQREYSSRLIDLQAEVDENLRDISEGELKQEIKLALETYADASTAWNEAGFTSGISYVACEKDTVQVLFTKYNIKCETLGEAKIQMLNTVLSTIWNQANNHIEKAANLNQ